MVWWWVQACFGGVPGPCEVGGIKKENQQMVLTCDFEPVAALALIQKKLHDNDKTESGIFIYLT